MNVLSLFDGMSCGHLALDKVGIKVDNYYACEIDKPAITVTKTNYPDTHHLGSVTELNTSTLPKIDLLIGGSPCQGFSFAGKMNGAMTKCDIDITTLEQYMKLREEKFEFEGQSYLFWEYMRILTELREVNPNIKFLLENVIMTEKWKLVLNEAIGVEAFEISSAKIVPQGRRRLFWCNFGVEELEQEEYDINDYIDGEGFPTSCNVQRYFKKKKIFNTLTATYWKGIRGSGRPTVSTAEGYLDDDRSLHRMLTPNECERLQTVPKDYTSSVAKTNRYKMLGNGWTVDVIVHIFKYINSPMKDGSNILF